MKSLVEQDMMKSLLRFFSPLMLLGMQGPGFEAAAV
jgi:hypothetical protein